MYGRVRVRFAGAYILVDLSRFKLWKRHKHLVVGNDARHAQHTRRTRVNPVRRAAEETAHRART